MIRHLPIIGLMSLTLAAATPALAADLVLNETGSTLVYPLFQQWVTAYASVRPEVKISAAGEIGFRETFGIALSCEEIPPLRRAG